MLFCPTKRVLNYVVICTSCTVVLYSIMRPCVYRTIATLQLLHELYQNPSPSAKSAAQRSLIAIQQSPGGWNITWHLLDHQLCVCVCVCACVCACAYARVCVCVCVFTLLTAWISVVKRGPVLRCLYAISEDISVLVREVFHLFHNHHDSSSCLLSPA